MNVKLSHYNSEEHRRVERLARVLAAAFQRCCLWPEWSCVVELHDHKGILQVTSTRFPDLRIVTVLRDVWKEEGGEDLDGVEFLDPSGREWA